MRIAREAWPWVLPLAALTLALGLLLHPLAAVVGALPTLFVLWFFRDPERTPPPDRDALVCPADGRVIQAGPRRVSVFMNVFNVHVCRAPVGGRVESVVHHAGRFLAAFKEHASEQNERVEVVLEAEGTRVRFTLVAGLVARRIVCKLSPGQRLAAGERVGLIRFGSRVDVALPPGATATVAVGDRVTAGESVVARMASGPPAARG